MAKQPNRQNRGQGDLFADLVEDQLPDTAAPDSEPISNSVCAPVLEFEPDYGKRLVKRLHEQAYRVWQWQVTCLPGATTADILTKLDMGYAPDQWVTLFEQLKRRAYLQSVQAALPELEQRTGILTEDIWKFLLETDCAGVLRDRLP